MFLSLSKLISKSWNDRESLKFHSLKRIFCGFTLKIKRVFENYRIQREIWKYHFCETARMTSTGERLDLKRLCSLTRWKVYIPEIPRCLNVDGLQDLDTNAQFSLTKFTTFGLRAVTSWVLIFRAPSAEGLCVCVWGGAVSMDCLLQT